MKAQRGVHGLQSQASLLGDQPTALCGYGAGWRKVCRDRTLTAKLRGASPVQGREGRMANRSDQAEPGR